MQEHRRWLEFDLSPVPAPGLCNLVHYITSEHLPWLSNGNANHAGFMICVHRYSDDVNCIQSPCYSTSVSVISFPNYSGDGGYCPICQLKELRLREGE